MCNITLLSMSFTKKLFFEKCLCNLSYQYPCMVKQQTYFPAYVKHILYSFSSIHTSFFYAPCWNYRLRTLNCLTMVTIGNNNFKKSYYYNWKTMFLRNAALNGSVFVSQWFIHRDRCWLCFSMNLYFERIVWMNDSINQSILQGLVAI